MSYKFDVIGQIDFKINNEKEIDEFLSKIKDQTININLNIDNINNLDKVKDDLSKLTGNIKLNIDDNVIKVLERLDTVVNKMVNIQLTGDYNKLKNISQTEIKKVKIDSKDLE